MAQNSIYAEAPKGGFSFDNYARNKMLESKGFKFREAHKTGTTIAGCVFKDGIVLGADTRATDGDIVADKYCEKIHYISDKMYCCGAGTAADTEMVTKMISAQLELHRLNSYREPRVVSACTLLKNMLFRYRGYVGAYLILGGVDPTGAHLYSIHAHGSTDQLPFMTLGSGSLAAMAVFEARYKPDMNKENAMALVRDAIRAGILNDLGSGSQVDLCIITRDGTEYLRGVEQTAVSGKRLATYDYAPGTTPILSTSVRKIDFEIETTRTRPTFAGEGEHMDTD